MKILNKQQEIDFSVCCSCKEEKLIGKQTIVYGKRVCSLFLGFHRSIVSHNTATGHPGIFCDIFLLTCYKTLMHTLTAPLCVLKQAVSFLSKSGHGLGAA